ncbi:MAG: hypothetical protein EZS28_016997 [Streblomastix strix]|uniref:Uncharacterized protein n=1 Tax=Streblomastix strix TaxID=222440 RepID=A0A5J4VY03_9EUKA|nr:MAG: hypothetical protein EZS28_016997 [Streblomastix strix]
MQQQDLCFNDLESQIENLFPNEATFHIDFKENFNIGMNRDQRVTNFFAKAPVTCLTAVVHKGKPHHLIQKKVITLLSPVLTHNCSFTLFAVQKMFESQFMKDIEQVHWWSDGGQHFRNKQLIWALLNEEDILIPGTNFEVNFTVPSHGKGAPDGIFGMYSIGLRNNMPKEDNEILARPLTGIADAGVISFQMKSTVKQVKRTPKRSTALIKDE